MVKAIAMLVPALLLVLPGCGGKNAPSNREWSGRDVPPTETMPGFTVSVETDRTAYRVGDTIRITVSARNDSDRAVTLSYFTGSPSVRWGYLITGNSKIVAYEYWSGHRWGFTEDVGVDTYAPGETKRFVYTYPLDPQRHDPDPAWPLPPGTYQVQAKGPYRPGDAGAPVPLSTPVTITVTP